MTWLLHHWFWYVVIMFTIFSLGQIIISLTTYGTTDDEKDRLIFAGLCLIWPLSLAFVIILLWTALACVRLPIYVRDKYKAWREWGV